MLILLVLLQAGVPPPEASQTLPAIPLERAIRELERSRIRLEQKRREPPTFRVEIQDWLPSEPWIDRQTAPWPLKIPRGHHEFLRTVTPEEFRGSTLHPCCIDLLPIFESIGDRLKARRESRAKQRVEQALRDWHAATAKDKSSGREM